jgi:uncharacterized protein
VNDYAGLLTAAERDRLEALLTERERVAGPQMAIAVFKSLDGESVEDAANRLFQKWRLGSKALDNGVLLVLFVEDRKVRIEVGYGLEATLTDAASAQIIREALAPRFREQRYAAGLEAAVNAVYDRIASPQPLAGKAESRRGLSTREIYLLFFLACVGITFVSLAWNVSHQRGYTAGRRGWRSSGPGGWYGGGLGGGGFGGGGWSGGGGGGFSGGGGSSGGGGASGSW